MNDSLRCECGTHVSLRPGGKGGRVSCACGRSYIAIGERVGKVRILDVLGRGGMGVVYRAKHVDLDRVVALKVLSPALVSDPEFVKRFYREARAAARISDPNVVQIHEVGQAEKIHYIVMEYVDGRPLSDLLSGGRPLPLRRAIDLLEQLLSAIRVVHEAGLMHRDIKPANVLLDAKGRVKLTDFGLARPAQGDEVVTLTGMVVGTPPYMSPEQARGSPLDAQSDLYSLGVVFFEMLSGRLPFEAATPVAIMLRHTSPDPAPRLDQVPAPVARLVARMLEKDLSKRAASAAVLLQELRTMRPGLNLPPEPDTGTAAVVPAPRPTRSPRRLRPALLAASGVVAFAAILLAIRSRPAPTADVVSFDPDFAEGRVRIRDSRWSDASELYAAIDARSSDPAVRAHARSMRAMVDEWGSANRRLDEGAVEEAEMRISILAQEAEKLADGEDRLLWRSVVAPLQARLAGSAQLQAAFDAVASAWPKDGGPPPHFKAAQLAAFAEKPEHPVTVRFHAWLELRMEALFEKAETLIDEGRLHEAVNFFQQIGRAVPMEPWLSKAREAEQRVRAAPLFLEGDGVERPLFTVPLDFVPSDFLLTRDGRFLVALHRSKGTLIVVSVEQRAVVKEVAVGYEPAAVAQVGDRLYVCGRTASAIQIVDCGTWARTGSVALPSTGPHAIAVATAVQPPRVFVATTEHLVEIDPEKAQVIRQGPAAGRGTPASLAVVPTGERLFVNRLGSFEVWSTKEGFEREGSASVPGSGPVAIDGQGQYLITPGGAYDHFLNPRAQWSGSASAIATHPGIPRAYLCKSGSITPVDLYRLRVGEEIRVPRIPQENGITACARMSSDARMIVVAPIQHPNVQKDVAMASALMALSLPWKEPPGYFAFTSPPPCDAWLGFPMRYAVRLSDPFSKKAKLTLELSPDGMTLDPAKREIVWTPGAEQAGKIEVQLRAVDASSGLDIRQTIQLEVRYRVLFDRDAWITNDARYLFSEGKAFDLDEDRYVTIDITPRPSIVSYVAGRLYWIDPGDETVCSCAMDGSDRKRHPMEGLSPGALLPKCRTGPMLAIAQDDQKAWQIVAVGDARPSRLFTLRDSRSVSISPDGSVIFAQSGGDLSLFRLRDGVYQDAEATGLREGFVQFSGDGGYFLHEDGIFELTSLRRIKGIGGGRAGLDPSGPYFAVPGYRSVEVFKLGTLQSVGRFEVKPAGWRGGGEPSVSVATPLSSRTLLLMNTSMGVVVVPFKY